ncbi:MAG TPA: tetratricopeptide repeat protein [Thiobacillaceae bacterium]|nr:tetratricopeptide repeat protein [Thiobacillaceae bacterium]
MSLLLKALKQAEIANADRGASEDRSEVDDAFAREAPRATGSAPGREWVEPPGLLLGTERSASTPGSAARFKWPRLSLVPLVALLAGVIAIGYGIYLYFALQPPAPLSPVAETGAMPTPHAALPTPLTQTEPQADVSQETASPVESAPAPEAAPSPQPVAVAPATASPRARAGGREAATSATPDSAARPNSLQFRPDPQALLLGDAYAAYQRGAFDEAQRLYGQAATRGNSVDALLGLAAVASVQHRDTDARDLYREVLALDPHNAAAQAALLDLSGSADPAAAESRLKTMIERTPAPQLYQTLGNLYADQGRWSEAQDAYFKAYQGAPDHADYAFNLAVALDQLHQYPAARSYYEKALTQGSTHRFDRAAAEARLQQLRLAR